MHRGLQLLDRDRRRHGPLDDDVGHVVVGIEGGDGGEHLRPAHRPGIDPLPEGDADLLRRAPLVADTELRRLGLAHCDRDQAGD